MALIKGLAYGYSLGIWIAGIGIALAWLGRGASLPRLTALAIAILWPIAPVALAFSAHKAELAAAGEFVRLCEQQAYERFVRRVDPVAGIYVDGVRGKVVDPLFRELGSELARLTRENPGYLEVQMLEPDSADGTVALRHLRDRSRGSSPPAKMTSGESIARFGVRLSFEGGRTDVAVREFRVRVLDSHTKEVLAEQKSFLYRSRKIDVGPFPLWRKQDRICPLSHPADFTRAALSPQPM